MAETKQQLCLHGHFYQPPRENPWLGVVQPQPGAAPFHDWNERISAECYAANARARIHDHERRIVRLANNYLSLSFNIGPTLMAWMERCHPNTTRRIIAADANAAERLGGHGNAIAQVYSHPIMPLCNERDKHTQIVWGIADFVHHFSREPEGMWLAECAIDMDTVRTLIDHGIRFVVLAPEQADCVRPFGGDWQNTTQETLDTRRPYRIFDHGTDGPLWQRHLDVFFFDSGISRGIAFQHLLRSAEKLDARIDRAFDPHAEEAQLVSVATDGESYGHHEPYGEMCLAFFTEDLVKSHDEVITNYGAYLAEHPPTWEARLWLGERGEGSSWSCKHGVDRWLRHCGCSDGGPDWHTQEWRAPLRAAFDQLRETLDDIFVREGAKVMFDPWDARDAYIAVLLDPSPARRAAFLIDHARADDTATAKSIWRLLAMQKFGMYMFTSCAWFFNDVARVEPVQTMRYALRATQLAKPYTDDDLLARLRSALEQAPSNDHEIGTAAGAFRQSVEPEVYSTVAIAACYVLTEMYRLAPPAFQHRAEFVLTDRRPLGDKTAFRGVLHFQDGVLFETTTFAFFAAHLSDREAACLLEPCDSESVAEHRVAAWGEMPEEELAEELVASGRLIRDMPGEERTRLLHHVLGARLNEVDLAFSHTCDDLQPLLTILAENDIEPPPILKLSAQFVQSRRFQDVCARLSATGEWDEAIAAEALALLEDARKNHLDVDHAEAAPPLADLVLEHLDRLLEELLPATARDAATLVRFCRDAGFFFENGGRIENRYWRLLRRDIAPLVKRLRSEGDLPDRALAEDQVAAVYDLGLALNFSPDHLDHLVDYTDHAEPDEGQP